MLLESLVGELPMLLIHHPPAVTAGTVMPVVNPASRGDVRPEDVLVDPVGEAGEPVVLEFRPYLVDEG